MKKTIQINIAGVVLTIEDDAYGKLNNYLKSIQTYFANYEGSQEIISDIEARIAEKFYEKQNADGQLIISAHDVDTLIASMGTVADFEALEEEGNFEAANAIGEEKIAPAPPSFSENTTEPKRIYRDTKRKALGGVLAGLAHHFNIDVTWMRIIFLLFAIGLSPITDSGASGIFFLAYIVCWIAFPPNDKLEEDPKIKKFYRNPDGKVVAGVSSGLAAYFGIDIAIVRLLFVVAGFAGAGIIAYIILWVSAPEANSLTQKMEMKGEPVTLENIETNIKRSLNVPEGSSENAVAKILLFPFRMIAVVISALGRLISNLGPIFRILIGLFLMFLGGVFTFAVIIATAAFFGVVANESWIQGTNEISMFARDISPWAGFFGFLAAFIPAISLFLLGISLLSKNQLISRNYWISGLGAWFIGVLGVASFATTYSLNFARDATHQEVQTFAVPNGKLILDAEELSEGDWQDNVEVDLEMSTSGDLRLEKEFRASGATRTEATENAKAIMYLVQQRDSLLVFDRWSALKEDASFRDQRLRMKLFIPANKPFKMTARFARHLLNNNWDFKRKNGIDLDEIEQFTFVMKNDEGVTCLDCPVLTDQEKQELEYGNDDDSVIGSYDFEDKRPNGKVKEFNLSGFRNVEVSNAFYVTIRQGEKYSVEAVAEREKDLDDLDIDVSGGTLSIEFDDVFISNREKVYVYITMPTLEGIEMSGAVRTKVIGFENVDNLSVGMSGASRAAIDIEAKSVKVEASGACRLDLRGTADKADFDVSGASRIDAKNIKLNDVDADASGASRISLGRVSRLNSDTSGASKITRE